MREGKVSLLWNKFESETGRTKTLNISLFIVVKYCVIQVLDS